MASRRTFLRASAAALTAAALGAVARAQSDEHLYYLPDTRRPELPTATLEPTAEPTATPTETVTPVATPGASVCPYVPPSPDAPILGPASGTLEQAVAWLAPRADASYSDYDIQSIVAAYRSAGESVGVDWFVAVAQMVHETGSITSWWSQRPRRNPAGIGVTGRTSTNAQDDPPGQHWAWNENTGKWHEGVSFGDWAGEAIPAHLGRLLAYALTDAEASAEQRAMIAYALSFRSLVTYRGKAKTWQGLNTKWAYPGCTYGQKIIDVARAMGGWPAPASVKSAAPGDEDGDWMPDDG